MLKIMKDCPNLIFLYWEDIPEKVLIDQDGIPISLTGKALACSKESTGSTPV